MNRRKKVAFVWLTIAIISFIAMTLPFIFEEIDMFNGGGAMIFIGAILGLTALITFFMYLAMAKREKRMNADMKSQIVKWEYTEDEWKRFADLQYKERIKESKQTWMIIAVISVITILPIWYLIQDLVFAVVSVAALLVFLSVFIVLPSVIQRRRILHSPRTTIIADNGVVVGKEIALFDLKFTWLNSLTISDRYLTFVFSAIASPTIIQSYNFRAPIKEGGEADIDRLIEFYRSLPKQPEIIDERQLKIVI